MGEENGEEPEPVLLMESQMERPTVKVPKVEKTPKAPRGPSHVSQHLDPATTILKILQFVGGSLVVYLDIPNSEETLIFDCDDVQSHVPLH